MLRNLVLACLFMSSVTAHALSITGNSPASGPVSGGTTVTITGTGFATTGTVTVTFGTVTTNANVFNDTALQCVTPAHAEGTVDIIVTNPDMSSATSNAAFIYFDPAKKPTITSINPTFGPIAGGTSVVITGTNFFANADVRFGGVDATTVTVDSQTQITATSPPHAAGTFSVVVVNADTQSATLVNSFTFYAPPDITGITTETGFTPPTGSLNGGQFVTISGSNFFALGNTQPTVTFGGTAATNVVVVDASTITCTTPAHAVGPVNVVVTNPDGQSDTLPASYNYVISAYTFTGGGGNSNTGWDVAANWNPGVPPDNGVADVTITGVSGSGGRKILLNAPTTGQFPNTRFIHSLTNSVSSSNDFQIDPGTNASSQLSIQSGLFENKFNSMKITLNVPLLAYDGMTYKGPSDQSISSTATTNGCILILTSTSTYPGATNLTNMVLQVGGTSVIPGRSSLVMSGALLDLRTGSTVVGSLSGGTNNAITNSLQTTVALIVGVDGTDTEYAGAIGKKYTSNGPFNFVKVGPGTLTLSGDNLNTQVSTLNHIISSGTLLITGRLPSASIVTVNQDGILAGTGTVPATSTPISPAAGGSIQPGNPTVNNGIGMLTAASMNLSGGDLTVNIAAFTTAGTDYDQLKVTGALTLDSASRLTINVNGLNTTGTCVNVVTYASKTGEFDPKNITLINNPFGFIPTIVYNATGLDIKLDPAVSTGAGITVNPTSGLVTTQSGGIATFTVVLNTAPTGDVTIALESKNTNAGTVSPPQLVFTTSNFDQPQTVTVTGVDSNSTANVAYTIETKPAMSSDTAYNNLDASDVAVVNRGDGIIVTATEPLITTESGGTATFTVVLKSPPNSDVFLPIVTSNANEGQPSPALLIFNSGNWNVPQTVTMIGVDDSEADGDQNYTIRVGPAVTEDTNGYKNLSGNEIAAINEDNESSVISITPGSGPIAGGTSVTITGTNFKSGATVTIGGIPASTVVFVNDTTITADTPPHEAGEVDVAVTNPNASPGVLSGGFIYFDPALKPTISAINPDKATTNGGVKVTIAGSKFIIGATVTIGGEDALDVTVLDSSTITATVPAIYFGNAGQQDVLVTNPDTQSALLMDGFLYELALRPTITSINPNTGTTNGGVTVIITGSNFVVGADETTIVTLGGAIADSVTITGTTTMTVVAGAIDIGSQGVVNVVITNPDGQSSLEVVTFTYTPAPAPTLASISPNVGSTDGGTTVTVTGTNFADGAQVEIDGVLLDTTFVSSTSLTAVTEAHASGLVDVRVINPDNQATAKLVGGFRFATPVVVTNITPASGLSLGGFGVTIAGSGFVTGASVTFGGTAATNVNVVTSTVLTATVPPHTAGLVDIVVTNTNLITGTLPSAFTYIQAPPPVIQSITPGGGSEGATVTITGTGFFAGATVKFDTALATNVVVVNATTITATVPPHAGGQVNVTVTNVDGQFSVLTNGFSYTPPPTVSGVTPATGLRAGGTAVTITGADFANGATVTFDGVPATSVVIVDANTITAVTPAHAAGAVDVAVTNPDTQKGTLAAGFIYNDPPVIDSPVTVIVATVVAGQTVVFNISATDPQGIPLTITYAYGDGTTDTTGQHAYTAAGTYTVMVTVSNGVNSVTSSVTITVKLAANLWVKKQSVKIGTDGKESWQAQYIFNSDRTSANIFNPASEAFVATLGNIPEIRIAPPTSRFTGAIPKFSFKTATGVNPAVSVAIDMSGQSIKLGMKNATITDTVPGVLRNTVTLGKEGFSIDEFYTDKGAFIANSGYRTTAFVVAAAKVTAKAPGKDSLSFSMLLGDPNFAYPANGNTVRFVVTNSAGATVIDKDFTSIVSFSSGKFKTGKDTNVPAGKFAYDALKGKMSAAVKGASLTGKLANSVDHVKVDVIIGDKTYTTNVTLFAPKAGSYSTKMP